jgi:hypothetical protein
MTYHVALKSHDASEPTIAWAYGWRPLSEAVACTTAPAPIISTVRRDGGLAESSLAITFEVNLAMWRRHTGVTEEQAVVQASIFEVGVLRAPTFEHAESVGAWDSPLTRYTWTQGAVEAMTPPGDGWDTAVFAANITGLASASTYFVVVRTAAGAVVQGVSSDPEMMRTGTKGMLYTVAHRISEFAMDVDFLENHDTASIEAMPLYFMTYVRTPSSFVL